MNPTKEQINEDLNPHKAARVAMALYNERYAYGCLGSMGFWNSLSEGEKDTCRGLLNVILKCRNENEH